MLEIGSGTGEHAICFGKALPELVWLPSDPDAASRVSIEAWIATEGLANVRAPVAIDVRREAWGVEEDAPFDAMISLNMVHIAPWEAALGLLAGAGRLLRPDGVLFFYGPFMLGGAHTAASNAAFDADLKRRDARWGVRDVDDLVSEAAPYGLELRDVVEDAGEQSFADLRENEPGLRNMKVVGKAICLFLIAVVAISAAPREERGNFGSRDRCRRRCNAS